MILIINGSPNKKSKTMEVANLLLSDTTQEVNIVNAYDVKVSSCDDCKYCEHKVGCKQHDDMDEVYNLLFQADTLILASPIYFGTMTDKMMTIINRFQRFYNEKFVHETEVPTFTNMMLISTQGSQKTRMFNGAKETFHILKKLFEPTYDEEILIPDSEVAPLLTQIDKDNIQQIKKRMLGDNDGK